MIPSVGKSYDKHFFYIGYRNKFFDSTPNLTHAVPSSGNANANATPIIAPGAENIGQAQILSEYSKPFYLEGLFGDADAGAFAGRKDDEDSAMLADEDGDI